MAERKKVLWLVSWYPNKYDAFDGDFIQRHAKAATLYDDVHVLFIKQSTEQKEIENTSNREAGLTEQIIYLPKRTGLYAKWKAFRQWQETAKAQVSLIIEKHQPDLIHVHVPWKAGLLALWAHKKYKIPYVVTEHWGIYNNVVEDNIYTRPFIIRQSLRRIYKYADHFISVSSYLGEGVNQSLTEKKYTVIPNVVDTVLFSPAKEKHTRFTFLHVSNMVPLKNVEGILKAFQLFLQTTGNVAQLILVGNRDDEYKKLAEELELLNTYVFFKGEVPYAEVAKEMQQSQVLILNSDIENSPCVIGEALCCGLPVIATDVGGIPELISTQNGILITAKNENALMDAMLHLYQHHDQYSTTEIASLAAQKFSRETIAQQFHSLYLSVPRR